MSCFDPAGMIDTAMGSIPALTSIFENAGFYTQHKQMCNTQKQFMEKKDGCSSPPAAKPVPRRASVPADAFTETLPGTREACCCGRMFKNQRSLRQHERLCLRKRQKDWAPLNAPKDPIRSHGLQPDRLGSVSRDKKDRVKSPDSETKNPQSTSRPIVPNDRMGKRIPTNPSSKSNAASALPKTVSATDKKSAAGNEKHEQLDDPLFSSFASLNLGSVTSQAKPSVNSFICPCGCECASQQAFEKHKRGTGCRGPQGRKGKETKKVKVLRVQYEKDEDLATFVAMHAHQGRYMQPRIADKAETRSFLPQVQYERDKLADFVAWLKQHKRSTGRHMHQNKGEQGNRRVQPPRPAYKKDKDLAAFAAIHAGQYHRTGW